MTLNKSLNFSGNFSSLICENNNSCFVVLQIELSDQLFIALLVTTLQWYVKFSLISKIERNSEATILLRNTMILNWDIVLGVGNLLAKLLGGKFSIWLQNGGVGKNQ